MPISTAIVSLLVLSGLPVDVTKLDGDSLTGELESVSTAEIVVAADGESHAIPTDELHEVRPSADAAAASPLTVARSEISVRLRDGSLLLPGEFVASQREATLTSPQLGELRVPKRSVASVRLSRTGPKLNAAWQTLLERKPRDDLVIVRKGDALDHVEGVVGAINAKSVNLLLDGRAIPIPRNRVFGVIYATGKSTGAKPLCRFDLIDGQQLVAAAVQFEDGTFTVAMTTGGKVNIPATEVRRIDFSLGKIRSLAEIDPASVRYPDDLLPELQSIWKYRRGRNSRGEPLLLGGRTYEDGLWIHSGTTLRYRLGREYRRLRGLMGIDEDIGDCSPEVAVVLRGDGRVLLDVTLRRGDDLHELDIDVKGLRDLEIEVTGTDPDGICEHLDLVEARLIK